MCRQLLDKYERCGGGPLSPVNSPTKKSPTKKRKGRDDPLSPSPGKGKGGGKGKGKG